MSGYIGNGPGRGQRQAFFFVATAGQTVFSGVDSVGLTLRYKRRCIDVYVNGLCLPSNEYTATDESTVTLALPLNEGDTVYIVALSQFDVANALALDQNGADILDKSAFLSNLGITPALQNALINGGMEFWQRGTSINCAAGSRTYTADRWFVQPAGASMSVVRSALVPATGRSRYSQQLTGAASITTVNAGQRIRAANIPQIKGTVVFQAQVYNGTGAAFTPTLLLGTPAAVDDFTTVTNRLTQVLQSCANGQFTQVSFSVDISDYTNIDNGLQVELQFPSGLLVATKDVKLTELMLQLGSVPTIFERPPLSVTYNLCLPYYQKSFPLDTAPAQGAGMAGTVVTVTASTGAGSGSESIRFNPPMRSTPTITTYTPTVGGNGWLDSSATAQRTAAVSDACDKGFRAVVNATTTAAAQHFIHWAADAEL